MTLYIKIKCRGFIMKKQQRYVVQANEFIRNTNAALNTVPLKLFKMLVSFIDTENPPKDRKITFTKKELVSCFKNNEVNYDYLHRMLKKLITHVTIKSDEEEEVDVPLIHKLTWKKKTDLVTVEFEEEVMPYLINLKKLFLKYPSSNITQFKSKYGLILYENLLSYERQYHAHECEFGIDQLRWITGTTKKFKQFNNFEERVVKTAVNDINSANVEILAKYEKIKTGRRITSIRFYYYPRGSYRDKTYEDAVRHSMISDNDNKKIKKITDVTWGQFHAVFLEEDKNSQFTTTQIRSLYEKYEKNPSEDFHDWIKKRVELFY